MSGAGARIEIDAQALSANLLNLRYALGHDEHAAAPEVCIVLKADAYGHGIDQVLPLATQVGFTIFGCASNNEARRIRELGHTGRLIRVRAAAPSEIAAGVALGVEEWLGGLAHARVVADIAAEIRGEIPVHLAVNAAGLSKEALDLDGPQGLDELAAVLALDRLRPRGICTHFPREEAADTRAGLLRFLAETERVMTALGTRAAGVQRHCATSYAALTLPESRLDLVRIGAAVYGDSSADAAWQRPAIRLVSEVATVNRYRAGATVGYERTTRLARESLIATVPLGYADGLPRGIGSGRGCALVHGASVPIVDHLAMNTLALDVTDVPAVRPGDEVVLYGAQGAAAITSTAFERASGQIAAAAYASWGSRLPRSVRGQGNPVV